MVIHDRDTLHLETVEDRHVAFDQGFVFPKGDRGPGIQTHLLRYDLSDITRQDGGIFL